MAPKETEMVVASVFEPYLTLPELAKLSHQSVDTLRRACARKDHPLPSVRVGKNGGRRMVRLSVFEQWLAEEEQLVGCGR